MVSWKMAVGWNQMIGEEVDLEVAAFSSSPSNSPHSLIYAWQWPHAFAYIFSLPVLSDLLALQFWKWKVLLSIFTYDAKCPLWILSSIPALLSSALCYRGWKTKNFQSPYHQGSSFILLMRATFGKPLSSSGGWRKAIGVVDVPLIIGHSSTAGIGGRWLQFLWLLFSDQFPCLSFLNPSRSYVGL